MERLSLKLGYCGDAEADCALEKSSCNVPDNWRSSGEMIGKVPYRAHGGICLLSETVRDKSLGRCGGAGGVAGRCAPNRESCQDKDAPWFDGVAFETSPGCTVEGTTFGKCGDRCSWSPRDCGPGEPWSFPAEGCACDAVRTGGCVRGEEAEEPGSVFCAVAEGGCHGGSTWLSPLELAAVGAECYVCMEETAPVDSGVLVPAAVETKEDSSMSPSVIIGGAVGGALLVALLASLLITRQMKKQKQQKTEEGSHAPSTIGPPSDLELSSPDNDRVSNLDVEDYESRDKLP